MKPLGYKTLVHVLLWFVYNQVVVLWGAKDRVVGVASMRFFDVNGSLKMGLQKRPFQFTNKLPFSWDPAAPPSGREPGEDGVWFGCGGSNDAGPDLWDDLYSDEEMPKEDWGFQLERVGVGSFSVPTVVVGLALRKSRVLSARSCSVFLRTSLATCATTLSLKIPYFSSSCFDDLLSSSPLHACDR